MPRLRQPSGNPSLPDTGPVVVTLDDSDTRPQLIYGSSTPAAKRMREADNAANLAEFRVTQSSSAPFIDPKSRPMQADGRIRPEGAAQPSAGAPSFEDDEDGNTAMRQAEARAKQRLETRLREAEANTAALTRWGQEQATKAAAATKVVVESQRDTVSSALATAESEVEAAKRQYAEAWSRGDGLGVANATQAMNDASYKINTLRQGLDELEVEAKKPPAPAPLPPLVNNNIEGVLASMQNLSTAERDWIRKHPETMLIPLNKDRMSMAYRDAMDRGIQRDTPEYFAFFEDRLNIKPAPDADDDYEEEPPVPPVRQQRRVSAPVRNGNAAPGNGGDMGPNRVRLTEAMRQAARIAGVDEYTYALGVKRLADAKREGMYGMSEQK